ncbi:dihydropteroate synthase [Undibacterium sp. SXout7W]|uniref:dihydropteroate synthase n=1 Tax=Undibacterium sp. SXout7W TaxID=3413049 RepID=UPI003BF3DD35
MHSHFQCGRYRLPITGAEFKPLVMGILNVTPDSFSDGGRYVSLDSAISRAEQMILDGVDIIDIGGESTRPGSVPLSLSQELDRVMPVIYALRDCGVPLSVDTYKPEVMTEALVAGIDLVNDINGFRSDAAIAAIANSTDAGLCVMHMQNVPKNMQLSPEYADVNLDVSDFLRRQIAALTAAGISPSRITIDPGFGFGKTFEHNVTVFRQMESMQREFSLPLLVGVSRKTMIGHITGKAVEHRLAGSVSAALAAISRGAKIVRVHDVAETVDAIKVWQILANN